MRSRAKSAEQMFCAAVTAVICARAVSRHAQAVTSSAWVEAAAVGWSCSAVVSPAGLIQAFKTSLSAGFAQQQTRWTPGLLVCPTAFRLRSRRGSEAYLVAGEGVDHARPLLHVKRRLVPLALQRRHARDRLHDRIVDPTVGVGTGGADAVDRAEDYPGVDPAGSEPEL